MANLSKTDPTARPSIPVEKQRAMGDVLDRWRLNNGWNPLDNKTQMASIASYVYELDAENVPSECYGELYSRALRSRVAAIQAGKQMPTFGVELLIAEWNGPNGLRVEMKEREIARGRTLTGQATSQCTKCFGTGVENLRDEHGNIIGARPGCQHEYVEGELATVADVEKAQAAGHQPHQDETDVQILKRLSTQTAYEWAQAIPGTIESSDLWSATACLRHAEKYCREIDVENARDRKGRNVKLESEIKK